MGPAQREAIACALKRTLMWLHAVLGDPPHNLVVPTAPLPDPRAGEEPETVAHSYHWHIEILPD